MSDGFGIRGPVEAFDALVERVCALIGRDGEEAARKQARQGLLEVVQDDRERALAVVDLAVEGALCEARGRLAAAGGV